MLARPATGEYGVLTLLTALAAEVSPVLDLPPGAFRPMPTVRSSVVRLTFRPSPVAVRDQRLLVELVRSAFTQRRKTLGNATSSFAAKRGVDAKAALVAAGIDPGRRPETLLLADFARLADVFTAP